MNKIKNFVIKHKIISGIIFLVVIFVGYEVVSMVKGNNVSTRYVLATVQKGTLTTSVTGTGQVAASNQVDLKPQVSGDITYLPVAAGQAVYAGQTIAQINSDAATRAVNNDKLSLANAQLSLQKAQKDAQDQASNSGLSDLQKSYTDGYQAVASTFVDFSNILTDLDSILNNSSHSPYFSDLTLKSSVSETALRYKNQADTDFYQTKKEYQDNFKNYQAVTINSDPATIVALLNQTKQTVQDLSAAANGTYNPINYTNERLNDPKPNEIVTDKSTLSSDISKIGNHLTALTSAITAIENAKDTTTSSNLSLEQAKLSVSQAQNSLANDQQTLNDHTIRAPFDGVIADVPAKLGDTVSSGTVIATIITKQQVAQISLNEIDAAKIALGQKAMLTFDAIDGLTISGKIVSIDLLGTVSQGVVTYDVKIGLDTEDGRVKSGMSVSAEIITAIKQDVLTVPNGAIKIASGANYVEELDVASTTKQVPVEIGLANDTNTEIISGLKEGDQVIARTITGTATTAAKTTTPSLLGGGGTRGGGAIGGLR